MTKSFGVMTNKNIDDKFIENLEYSRISNSKVSFFVVISELMSYNLPPNDRNVSFYPKMRIFSITKDNLYFELGVFLFKYESGFIACGLIYDS